MKLTKPEPPVPALYTLTNKNNTTLVLSNCGAALVSFLVSNKLGQHIDIVLGYPELSSYLSDEFYIGTVVGRFANRIAGSTVVIGQQPFTIASKNGAYHHHGGLVGFNKKLFTAEPFSGPHQTGITFKYTSPHLEEGFPGELCLQVIYTLDDDDAWTIEYKAVSSEATLINLTQHSYFNLTGNPANNINGHELKIFSTHYLPVNHLHVPTGELATVANTPFDFTCFKTIESDINATNAQLELGRGYDHSFVLERQHSPVLKQAASVREPMSGLNLEVFTTEPSLHLYTGNYLENVKGKNEVVYQPRSGFCLETQHFPDAPNHPHFPSTLLPAGEAFYSKTIYKVSLSTQ